MLAEEPLDSLECAAAVRFGLREGDPLGNHQLDQSPRSARARQSEPGPKFRGAFAHPNHTEVTRLSVRRDFGSDALAIVANPHNQILRVTQLHHYAAAFGVNACVPDGFIADSVNLIPDDWM